MDFLTDAQVARYGRFDGVPSLADLERFFMLDLLDRELLAGRRGDQNRLGLMLQATTVRFVGRFLEDPLDVPGPVVQYVADQLGIADAGCVRGYAERGMTGYQHCWQIREKYGFRGFEDAEVVGLFRHFLDGRVWTQTEGPGALFDQAVGWLRRNRVLLPGVSVLTRLVLTVRQAAADRTYTTLAAAAEAVDVMLPARLRKSLMVAQGQRVSELESWRRGPTRTSGPAMVKALDRASDLEGLGVRDVDCSSVPANRVLALARYGLASKAPALLDLAEPRRTAVLVAMTRHLDAEAIDDALELFELLMATRLINPTRSASAAERLAMLPRLAGASRLLAMVNQGVLTALEKVEQVGEPVDVSALWLVIEQVGSRAQIAAAVSTVQELIGEDDTAESAMRVLLAERYRTVRPFLGMLGQSRSLFAAPGGADILAAVRSLPDLAARKVSIKPLTPAEVNTKLVPKVWHRAVFGSSDLPHGAVDRDAYVVCVLEQLLKALRVRDVYAVPSHRYGDPRARLLTGDSWEVVRPEVLEGLGLGVPVHKHLREQVAALDAGWRQMADRLTEAGDDSIVKIVPVSDTSTRMRLSVEHLDALDIPASLVELRTLTAGMLPRIDLPELLLEVHAWTGYLNSYVHVSGENTRMRDLPLSVAALLIAEACNVGLVPVTNPNIEALTRGRLSHVDQNYVRGETHSAANAVLIAAQADVPIAQIWGGGLLASVDGIRFVVPVNSIHTGPSPKYFGLKKGLTWMNAVNDQVAGIGAQVVVGARRDSMNILDLLLNLDGGSKPDLIATDEGAYSDLVFGVFAILGRRFSPRISDIGDTRYWRATWPGDTESDYGSLNAIARTRVNLDKIVNCWPDMLRVAGSLITHQIRGFEVLRMLGRDGRPTPLGQAFTEYGRIAKTRHLLAMVDPIDDTHRRAINTQTTVQESRHSLARKVVHGRKGKLYQKYRAGQENQLGALGIVLNAITLWNTRYLNAAVQQLSAHGHPLREEDVRRLSPLGHAHINELGRYVFPMMSPDVELRPLRDPTAEPDAHNQR